jgi:hypothetical protein
MWASDGGWREAIGQLSQPCGGRTAPPPFGRLARAFRRLRAAELFVQVLLGDQVCDPREGLGQY